MVRPRSLCCVISIVEFVVFRAGALGDGAALEELRACAGAAGKSTGFSRLSWRMVASLSRIAADLALQIDDINELVGLTAQLVRHHGRLGRDGGNPDNANTAPLHRLHQGAEIAIPGKQHHLVEWPASSMASTASSMSILPFTLRRPV